MNLVKHHIETKAADLIKIGLLGSESSQKQYKTNINVLRHWTNDNGLDINKTSLILFFTWLKEKGKSKSTIRCYAFNIQKYFKVTQKVDLTTSIEVDACLKGIYRSTSGKIKQAQSIDSFEKVQEILTLIKEERYKLLFSLMFYGAMRSSEVRNLKYENLSFEPDRVIINLSNSKTNQEGLEELKIIPKLKSGVCAYSMLEKLRGGTGFIFVTKNKTKIGYNQILEKFRQFFGSDFSTHSCRATFITESISKGAKFEDIKRQTGHKSDIMIERYNRKKKAINNNSVNLFI